MIPIQDYLKVKFERTKDLYNLEALQEQLGEVDTNFHGPTIPCKFHDLVDSLEFEIVLEFEQAAVVREVRLDGIFFGLVSLKEYDDETELDRCTTLKDLAYLQEALLERIEWVEESSCFLKKGSPK